MKKLIPLLLTAALCLSLAACQADESVPQATELVHQHTYTKQTTAPTCTKAGYHTYTCECGDYYLLHIVDAPGHSYTDEIVAPTAETQGFIRHTCKLCGDAYQDTYCDPLTPSHQHSYATSKVNVTCVTMGYTVYTCPCGDSYMDDRIAPLGHSYQDTVVAPAPNVAGYTEHLCAVCGDSYTDSVTEALPVPHEHLYALAETITPTCRTDGYTMYRCQCGVEIFTNFVKGEHAIYLQMSTPATHTKEGYNQYACEQCDHSYTESIACTPEHNYVLDLVVEPTCVLDGMSVYYCECGDSYTADHVPSKGHNYVADEVIAPTHNDQGYTVYRCTRCDKSYHDDFTEKLPPENPEHPCSGDCHVEIQQGGYTYVYCTDVESPFLSEDGFTVYYPYEYYF